MKHVTNLFFIVAVIIGNSCSIVLCDELESITIHARTFLNSIQQADGSWGNDPNSFGQFIDVAYAIRALEEPSTIESALEWIRNKDRQTISELAWSIELFKPSGDDVTNDISKLLSAQSSDYGWGAEPGFSGDVLHTILAIRALGICNLIAERGSYPLTFILYAQNDDGGWGCTRGKGWGSDPVYADPSFSLSNIYITSLVIQTFKEYRLGWDSNISSATAWLSSVQNPDGGWGIDATIAESDIASTSHALRALILAGQTGPHVDRAMSYLVGRQLPNGSWNQNVFDTALAILGLELYETPPQCKYTLRFGKSITDTWCEEIEQGVWDQIAMYGIDVSNVVPALSFVDKSLQLWAPPPQVRLEYEISVTENVDPGIYPFEVVLYLYDENIQVLASFTMSECVIIPLPCDLDSDWDVDMHDFAMFARHWRQSNCSDGNDWCDGTDLAPDTPDGAVNIEDLAVLTENWLKTLPAD